MDPELNYLKNTVKLVDMITMALCDEIAEEDFGDVSKLLPTLKSFDFADFERQGTPEERAALKALPEAIRAEWQAFTDGKTRLASDNKQALRWLSRTKGQAVRLYSTPFDYLYPPAVTILVGFGAHRRAHAGFYKATVRVAGCEIASCSEFYRGTNTLLYPNPLPIRSIGGNLHEKTEAVINGWAAGTYDEDTMINFRNVYAICAVVDDTTYSALTNCDFGWRVDTDLDRDPWMFDNGNFSPVDGGAQAWGLILDTV
jgi:hypothetical protein